jgi:phosphatidylglycerophosphate synthase
MTVVTADPKPFRNATRVLNSMLSPLEKRTLLFIAPRLPAWVNSDHLTGLGLAAMLCAGLSFWIARAWSGGLFLVPLCLAVNWFGDSLDGTLARVRGHERPRYGFYVDHMVDAFGALFLLGGMALSGYMSPAIAGGVLIAYLMMSAEVYLAAHTLGQFKITYASMGPTELRILLSTGALWLLVRSHATILGRSYLLFDVGGLVAIAVLLVILVATTIQHTRALYLAEPIRRTQPSRATGRDAAFQRRRRAWDWRAARGRHSGFVDDGSGSGRVQRGGRRRGARSQLRVARAMDVGRSTAARLDDGRGIRALCRQ